MSKQKPFHVVIIGAGPGGLVLAQILRQDPRFRVTVCERSQRDGSSNSSLVGFCILAQSSILEKLRDRLSEPVASLIDLAIGVPQVQGNRVALMDEKCAILLRMDMSSSTDLRTVSRWKLREAMLHGADEFV